MNNSIINEFWIDISCDPNIMVNILMRKNIGSYRKFQYKTGSRETEKSITWSWQDL